MCRADRRMGNPIVCNRWTGSVCLSVCGCVCVDSFIITALCYDGGSSTAHLSFKCIRGRDWAVSDLLSLFSFPFRCWRVRPRIMSACCSTTVWKISCDSEAIWVSSHIKKINKNFHSVPISPVQNNIMMANEHWAYAYSIPHLFCVFKWQGCFVFVPIILSFVCPC